MVRSKWKGPYIEQKLLKQIIKNINSKGKSYSYIKTRSKESYIMPFFVGLNFQVYNGKNYIKLKINDNMIGYKLGEFVATRKKRN